MHSKDIKPVMEPSGRYLKAVFTGMAAGFLFAFLLGRSVWIEMRINIGHVMPISVIFFVFFFALRKRSATLVLFLLLELLALIAFFSTYGFSFSAALIVPAAFFRDGFHLGFLSLPGISLFLLCSLGTVNTVWICTAATNRRRNKGSCHPATDQINVRDLQYGPERRYHG